MASVVTSLNAEGVTGYLVMPRRKAVECGSFRLPAVQQWTLYVPDLPLLAESQGAVTLVTDDPMEARDKALKVLAAIGTTRQAVETAMTSLWAAIDVAMDGQSSIFTQDPERPDYQGAPMPGTAGPL
jgi:hypothetical protein